MRKEKIKVINVRFDMAHKFEEEAELLLEDGYTLYFYQLVTMKGLYIPMIHALFIKNLDYVREPPDILSVMRGDI